MVVAIPAVTAQDPTPTLTPTVAPQPACQLYHPTVANAAVRSCAGLDCQVVAGVSNNDTLCVLGVSDTPGWLMVNLEPEIAGSPVRYISADVVAIGPPGFTQEALSCEPWEITASEAVVRQCAGSGCSVLGGLPQGTQVCVQGYGGQYEDWLYVDYSSLSAELKGWVSVDVARRLPEGTTITAPGAGTTAAAQIAATVPASLTPSPTLPVCPPGTDVEGAAALNCVTPTPTPIVAAASARVAGGPFIGQDVALTTFRVRNIELGSPRGAALFRFSLPGDWLADGNNVLYLSAEYFETVPAGVSVEDRAMVSTLNVYLDDELISTIPLNRNNIGQQTLIIPLPGNLMTVPDDNSHVMQLVLEAEDHCLVDAIARLFIRSDLSYFHFEYHKYLPRLDLARYPEPFYYGEIGETRERVVVVLPDDFSETELQAAASIVTGLGQQAFNEVEPVVLRAGELTEALRRDNNLVLIGEVGRNPVIDQLYADDALLTKLVGDSVQFNGQPVEETDGIVELIANPNNEMRAIGVVTGQTEAALLKAAQALSGPPSILGLGGPLALVADVRDVGQIPPGTRIETRATFADLGIDQLLLTGVGSQIAEVKFLLPAGAQLAPDAYVDLIFNHSAALGQGSTVTLLMNSTPLTSAFLFAGDPRVSGLETDEQGRNHLKARVPPESVVPGELNTLSIVLDVQEQVDCVFPDPLVTWFNVSPESELFLPRAYVDPAIDMPLLSSFPVPFNALPNLQDVLISLPAEPSGEDLAQAFQILGRLGADTIGGMAFKPRIVIGDLPSGLDLSEYHVIVIGRPTTNQLLADLNSSLPQPFVPGTDQIDQTLDDVVYRIPPGFDIGVLEILKSPWSLDRAVLVISGTGPLGQSYAARALAEDLYGGGLRGDVAFVTATDATAVDTRDIYYADTVVEEIQALETSVAVEATETANPVFTVTPGPTSTPTATRTPTPILSPTPILPTATELRPLPTFTPLPQEVLQSGEVQQPEWINILLIATVVVVVTTLIFGLLVLRRSR
ncbi:MAG: hypothetical protein Kow0077_07350 [Anaerolineae bacterium]